MKTEDSPLLPVSHTAWAQTRTIWSNSGACPPYCSDASNSLPGRRRQPLKKCLQAASTEITSLGNTMGRVCVPQGTLLVLFQFELPPGSGHSANIGLLKFAEANKED